MLYPAPEYEDFCPSEQVEMVANTEVECLSVGGKWHSYQDIDRDKNLDEPIKEPTKPGYCDEDYICRQIFDDAHELYERNVFVILVSLGLVSLILGFIFGKKNYVLSAGLSLGGVLSLVIASIRYWSTAENLLRVGILAVALAVLIYLAIKKFK